MNAILLFPLQEFTLEVHLLVCHRVEIEHCTNDAFLYELKRIAEAAVEINRSHEGFKAVAFEVGIVCATVGLTLDETIYTQLLRQFAERFA